ncbi:hypothetical protein BJL83_16350 [Vibrio parahaemolyticus]|nr:hypothetical protein BJL83_16350 [Vibrio parahaemolyticus]
MRSHYKRIGDYVTQIKLKNTDDSISSLKGININKHFMPSVANINGTDLSKYRVVKKNQFAFNPMHVGRDEVLPISMLEDDEPIIVSPAYVVFEVKDEEELLPAYLMMWCRRSEFDRNAWFMTDNSVRGGFSWADFCDMELPVPSIEKQREIVREYNVVNDRIALNEQLTQKLEDTAQAIYKQWFVDFEFPISKEYAQSIGKPELEGKPYKSSGGEMKYCERIEADVPAIWKTQILDDVLELIIDHRGKTPLKLGGEWSDSGFPAISAKNVKKGQIVQRNTIRFVDSSLYAKWMKEPLKTDDLIMTSEAPMGELLYICSKTDYLLSQRLYALRTKKQCVSGVYLYFWLQNPIALRDMEGRASGTTVLGIKQSELRKVNILTPDSSADRKYFELMAPLFNQKEILSNEKAALKELAQMLLVKLSRY